MERTKLYQRKRSAVSPVKPFKNVTEGGIIAPLRCYRGRGAGCGDPGGGLEAQPWADAPADRDRGGRVGGERGAVVGVGEGGDTLELVVGRGGQGKRIQAVALGLEAGGHRRRPVRGP